MDENAPAIKHLENVSQNTELALHGHTETKKAVQNLEVPLDGILLGTEKANETLKTIAENTQEQKKAAGMTVEVTGVPVITIKGEKGDAGAEPTDARLQELIKPLIPSPIKGDRGLTGKDSTAQGPKGDKGDSIVGPKGDSIPGPRGLQGPKGDTVIGPAGKDGSPDNGTDIKAKLENLPAGKRLDYEKLDNLPDIERIARVANSSKSYATSELTDVSMQGIVPGQLLQWDGMKFIPYTPSSSTMNQVFGEVIGTVSSASFTLAHTPVLGTVRIYRGGAYQQAGAGKDYTLSGAVGTLSSVLQTGEVLLADYNY